jgi:hypothetical protein
LPRDRNACVGSRTGRHKAAIHLEIRQVKSMGVMVALVAMCDIALAESIPLPMPRPVPAEAAQPAPSAEEPSAPSACFLRLTSKLADASALPRLTGAGGCGAEDVVRLEAIILDDKKSRVAVTPPAVLRCSLAEAIAQWVREDVVPAVRPFGSPPKTLDNYASYDCRGRNRVAGARLSEHGKANALDMRSIKLADGKVLGLTDIHVGKELRSGLMRTACARFTTVLGPGSDGYHEDHVHIDLAERRSGYRICHWDVREPGDQPAVNVDVDANTKQVPLPRPRPFARAKIRG